VRLSALDDPLYKPRMAYGRNGVFGEVRIIREIKLLGEHPPQWYLSTRNPTRTDLELHEATNRLSNSTVN
jgi:hypothetical protein